MPTPTEIKNQINRIIEFLVEVGLAGDQNYALQRATTGGGTEITFPHADHVSISLKQRLYAEIYNHLTIERAYNAIMPDGAIIQMMYFFENGTLERHRLAFFAAPHLRQFQNSPEIYLEDEIYADIVAQNIVPFPLRFDYDSRDGAHKELTHPKSHLTLGQYQNCRVPVTAPITPSWFIDFILRNFYHTAFNQYADKIPPRGKSFGQSILPTERKVVHIAIP